MDRPTALALSPHLDDAAFSCGGTLAGLARRGWRVTMATVFTASVAGPTGFALACQLDKGLGPEVDYLAIRRDEDSGAARALGVEPEWLGLPEAPHRGYESAPSLFAGVREGDEIGPEVGEAIDRLVARLRPDLILAPQGVGNHVDHLQVVAAIRDRPGLLGRTAWYRDLPYAAKFPEAGAAPGLPAGLVEAPFPLGAADLRAKLAGSACYATQLGFQFGGVGAMGRMLADFAGAEGRRLGVGGPAEVFLVADQNPSFLRFR